MNKMVIGLCSNTQDGYHIPMFDTDIKQDEYVYFKTELQNIQRLYYLSDIFIIKSTNGYNALTLDKVQLKLLPKIYYCMDFVDKAFLDIGRKREIFDIRIGQDKEIHEIIKSKTPPTYIQSNAHRLFINTIFDLNKPIPKTKYFDNYKIVSMVIYQNKTYGYVEDKNVNP